MLSKKKEIQLDRIIKSMQSGPTKIIELNDKEFETIKRMEIIDSLLRKYGSPSKVANMIVNDSRFGGIKKTRAYQLIQETKYIYNTAHKLDVDYFYQVVFEKAFETLNRAILANSLAEQNKAIKNLAAILATCKEENPINADLLNPHEYTLLINLPDRPEGYKLSLNKLHEISQDERVEIVRQLEAEDLEFDMVEFIQNEEAVN